MEFYIFFVLSFFCVSLYRFFSKKLVVLLMIEAMMIFLLLSYVWSCTSSIFSFPLMIFLSCFMVLDSVFGISTLICCSRASSELSPGNLIL